MVSVGLALSACRIPPSDETASSQSPPGPPAEPAGRWHPAPETGSSERPEQEALSRLRTLPYSAGSVLAPAFQGVTRFEPSITQPGLNLYNSGHGPEALLIDLQGKVLHRWSYPIERIWPDAAGPHQSSYWRRVAWLPGGDILAIFEGIGLIRLDRESRLKWAFRGPVHHQAAVQPNGDVVTLTRRSRLVPAIDPEKTILDDHVALLSPEGRLISEISLLDAFERSPYRDLLEGIKRLGGGDIFHTNSIEILDGTQEPRLPWARSGNLLLSILFLDTICVLDPGTQSIVWALRGNGSLAFSGQHDPRVLPGGRILLFDNWGRSGKSKVIEFDPLTRRVAWRYPVDPGADFYTATCGVAQRLNNGNTLITESEKGRSFEVTADGDLAWEFYSPHRAGENRELIATLFEVKRVPEAFFFWK